MAYPERHPEAAGQRVYIVYLRHMLLQRLEPRFRSRFFSCDSPRTTRFFPAAYRTGSVRHRTAAFAEQCRTPVDTHATSRPIAVGISVAAALEKVQSTSAGTRLVCRAWQSQGPVESNHASRTSGNQEFSVAGH